MAGTSKIEWTESVWNPITGCSKVSPGCAHCYAEALSKRYAGANGWPAEFRPWTAANAAENVILHPERLEAPLHWRTPRRVFVNSMSDLFHEQVPDEFIDEVFAVMALTPMHTYQILTKRPERMRNYLTASDLLDRINAADMAHLDDLHMRASKRFDAWADAQVLPPSFAFVRTTDVWPLPNVWLGVSVENQRWTSRIDDLRRTPAAVRFISAEPLLDFLSIADWLTPRCLRCGGRFGGDYPFQGHLMRDCTRDDVVPGLDWVIVGGESGPRHRPFDPDWARSIVAQCRDAGVACFIKQLGGARPGNELEDLPDDLKVREFPS